jgi:hypothetical protein
MTRTRSAIGAHTRTQIKHSEAHEPISDAKRDAGEATRDIHAPLQCLPQRVFRAVAITVEWLPPDPLDAGIITLIIPLFSGYPLAPSGTPDRRST